MEEPNKNVFFSRKHICPQINSKINYLELKQLRSSRGKNSKKRGIKGKQKIKLLKHLNNLLPITPLQKWLFYCLGTKLTCAHSLLCQSRMAFCSNSQKHAHTGQGPRTKVISCLLKLLFPFNSTEFLLRLTQQCFSGYPIIWCGHMTNSYQ